VKLIVHPFSLQLSFIDIASGSRAAIHSVLPVVNNVGDKSRTDYYCNCFRVPWTLSGTTQVSWYQGGKTRTGARDSEWQWHQSRTEYYLICLYMDKM